MPFYEVKAMKLANFNKHLIVIQTWVDAQDESQLDSKQKKRLSLIKMSIDFAKDIKGDTPAELKERQGEWDTIRNNGKYFDDFPVIKTGSIPHTDEQIKWKSHNIEVAKSHINELEDPVLEVLRLIITPSARKGGYWALESMKETIMTLVTKELDASIKAKRDNAAGTELLEGALHAPNPPPIKPKPVKKTKKA